MKIKMSKTTDGSVNGAIVTSFQEGVEYDLSNSAGERDLAKSFVKSACAEQTGPDDPIEADQEVTGTPGPAPVNIAPPDQISTNVHPADVEAVPSRGTKAAAPKTKAT